MLTKELADSLENGLRDAANQMQHRAALLTTALQELAIAQIAVVEAKFAVDLIADAALLNPDANGGWGTEKQRQAAVNLWLATHDPHNDAKNHHHQQIVKRAMFEGRVEEARALLSIAKRRAEMAVAVARLAGAD